MFKYLKEKWNKFKKWIISILGIGVVLAAGSTLLPNQQIPEYLELKADKEDILFSKDINENTKQYIYNSGIEVPQVEIEIKDKKIKEDMSKRTKNAQFFKTGIKNGEEIWKGRFYVGEPFYKKDNKWYQTEIATTTKEVFDKEMKVSWFKNIANAAESFYVGAGDGHVYTIPADQGTSQQNWDAAHDAVAGTGAIPADNAVNVLDSSSASQALIYRAFFPIDTSSIDSSAVIISGILSLRQNYLADSDNDGNDWINVVQTSQADSTTLATTDFNKCGATTTPIEGSTRFDITGSVNDWKEFVLNGTGLSWVKRDGDTSNCGSTAGYTCLGMRGGHDALDDLPDNQNRIDFYASNNSGTTFDPYIEIIYSVGGIVTEEIEVSINTDFVFCYSNGSCYNNLDGNIRLGYRLSAGGDIYAAARFNDVDVPQGATITEAYWSYTAYDNDASTDNVRLFAEDEDDSAVISTTYANAESPANKTPTTAYTNWTLPNQTTGTVYTSGDIGSVIQEVTDRGGWVSGNDLTILIRNNGATENHNADNWDDGVTTLTIYYEAEAAAATTPTINRPDIWWE